MIQPIYLPISKGHPRTWTRVNLEFKDAEEFTRFKEGWLEKINEELIRILEGK